MMNTGATLINTDELIERIVDRLDQDDIVVEGREWDCEVHADPNEFEMTERADDGTAGRRLTVRVDVTVSEA